MGQSRRPRLVRGGVGPGCADEGQSPSILDGAEEGTVPFVLDVGLLRRGTVACPIEARSRVARRGIRLSAEASEFQVERLAALWIVEVAFWARARMAFVLWVRRWFSTPPGSGRERQEVATKALVPRGSAVIFRRMTQSGSTSSAPDRRIWLDGALVPWQAATVHVLSHSFAARLADLRLPVGARDAARRRGLPAAPSTCERFLRSAAIVGLPMAQATTQLFARRRSRWCARTRAARREGHAPTCPRKRSTWCRWTIACRSRSPPTTRCAT